MSFVSLLRKHLMGAALVEVAAAQGDCVVSLDFAHGAPDAMDDLAAFSAPEPADGGAAEELGRSEQETNPEMAAGDDVVGGSDAEGDWAASTDGDFFRLVAELIGNMANVYLVDA